MPKGLFDNVDGFWFVEVRHHSDSGLGELNIRVFQPFLEDVQIAAAQAHGDGHKYLTLLTVRFDGDYVKETRNSAGTEYVQHHLTAPFFICVDRFKRRVQYHP